MTDLFTPEQVAEIERIAIKAMQQAKADYEREIALAKRVAWLAAGAGSTSE